MELVSFLIVTAWVVANSPQNAIKFVKKFNIQNFLDVRRSANIFTKNDSFASVILGFLECFSTFSLENTSKWLLLTLEAFTMDTILLSLSATLKRFPLDMTVLFTFRNKCIQFENRKTRTRRNSVFGHFSRSVYIFIHIR